MFSVFEKFVKKVEKLDNYCVLRQEKELIILGITVSLKVLIDKNQNPYGGWIPKPLPRKVATFFIATFLPLTKEIQEFKKQEIPILILDKAKMSASLENIKYILDDFVEKTLNTL